MRTKLKSLIHENKGFLLFIILMVVFRSSFADWNVVPTGSMQPTIVEGDRIWVNKLAYDLRLPLTHTRIARLADPERGDIVIFDSKVSDKRLVKRVIGLPSDIVAMRNNQLSINGQALEYTVVHEAAKALDLQEHFLGLTHNVRVSKRGTRASSFGPIVIPAGKYLALGDNRDNSADSRVIGLIPREEIIGRARQVVMSLDYDNYYAPRGDRFLKTL